MKNDLGELSAFAMVAEERSFTRAAARLGISQSALSHSIRGLEKRLGLQLLARTTRSVSPTAAGTTLLQELAPALERIERAVAETRKQREAPSGRIRLIIPRTASKVVILPKLAEFTRNYPEIVLEVTSSNDPVDLVAGEYDAGVQLGEFIQRDMIAVRVTREMRLAVVGSPQYFAAKSIPRHPQDLKDHACIGFRFSNGLYRWEFEKGSRALTVSPQGPVSFDDPELVIQAVLEGVGIGTAMENGLLGLIAEGKLVQVLKDWCPSFPGYFLYYPSRRNQPAALAALIETLRLDQ
ncbi:DNA-binding transcriptional regulator, LysR family [Granulicella pectinivorans]|uniref:DNA-binding transcriptional regulator, LysR family n=1 Tax=Granulicella pectinivorans TaxID=474950 RepID=A0A1I6LI69_9BACT|nr:LysR family transcriptional regulator [Granulicella pectinivorans]SFS03124.1 DNA-binding transcriptional regulator, LysR family [Granulicella pectinivorans]